MNDVNPFAVDPISTLHKAHGRMQNFIFSLRGVKQLAEGGQEPYLSTYICMLHEIEECATDIAHIADNLQHDARNQSAMQPLLTPDGIVWTSTPD